MLLPLEHPKGDIVNVAGNPLKFAGIEEGKYRYPPKLGEDTRHVILETLGISLDEYEELRKNGIVAETVDLVK